MRGNKVLGAALTAITAAVVGVILNLAIWFGMHVIFEEVRPVAGMGVDMELPVPASVDLAALALVVLAAIAVFRLRLGPVTVLAACAAAGMVIGAVGWA